MTVSVAVFRSFFGQVFVSETIYPNDAITAWIAVATTMLNPNRWGPASVPTPPPAVPVVPALPLTKLDIGTLWFVAHNLVLDRLSANAASRGGVPGQRTGAVSSDSVGPISRSYDTSGALELGAGHWNLSTYGQRFVRMADIVGTGPVTVGGGVPYGWGWNGNPAAAWGPGWPGPPAGWGPGWGGG